MKKRIIALAAALTVFAGCAKANPSMEELLKEISEGDNASSISRTAIYTAETDPDRLLGKEHSYTEKAGIYDTRCTGTDGAAIYIEAFNNEQDAGIRCAYFETVNECIRDFTEKNGFTESGSPVFREIQFHQSGNIAVHADESVGTNIAGVYFNVLDEIIGTDQYRQSGTLNEEEYEALLRENTEDAKSGIEAGLAARAEEYLSEVNKKVDEQLKKFADDLSDATMNQTVKLITETYDGKYFDESRKGWQEKYDALKAKKDENEAGWKETADNIESLFADALANPDQTKYDNLSAAVAEVPDNYYFEDDLKEWNRKLEELEQKLIIIERDKNAALVNAKLAEVESTHSPSLYDETKEMINSWSSDKLYEDFLPEWQERLDNVRDAVETERKKAAINSFKASCKSYTYKEFSRNSDDYIGEPVYFKGEVIQIVDQDSGGATMRVNVTANGTYSTWYSDTIYVEYDNSDEITTTKILEDDIIEIWGYGAGDVSYTSVLGAKVTVPAVLAKYIKVK